MKVIHTLAWLSIESSTLYVLYAGFARRSDRRAAIAGAVVATESLIFVANGFRCPLTDLAEPIGADRGSVTDIYLPAWLARDLPAIHAPVIVLAVCLHASNLQARRINSTGRHVEVESVDDLHQRSPRSPRASATAAWGVLE